MPCPCSYYSSCWRSCTPAYIKAVEEQNAFYARFPHMRQWHEKVAKMLEEDAKDAKEERNGAPHA